MSNFAPARPYVFRSGKRKGVVVESLMFNNYGFLLFLLSKIRKEKTEGASKNELEKHLEWIIARGEDRETKALCPQCGQNRVQYFSVYHSHFDFSASPAFTCCDSENCVRRLKGMATKKPVNFYPFKFSVLKNFRSKTDQKRIGNIFKWAFQLEKPLTREKLFRFFSE